MSWFQDWEARRDAMIAGGLPARVLGVELLPPWQGHRLLAVVLDIHEGHLPRSHQQRGFDLHISLIFEEEMSEELREAAAQLNARWAGRSLPLHISWMGSGGAAFLGGADALAADPDLRRLHAAGSYAHRDLHISL